jgi:hypothetical protein
VPQTASQSREVMRRSLATTNSVILRFREKLRWSQPLDGPTHRSHSSHRMTKASSQRRRTESQSLTGASSEAIEKTAMARL